jgi:hypothetical protein
VRRFIPWRLLGVAVEACLMIKDVLECFFTKGRRTGFTEMALDHLVQLSTTTKIKVRYYIKI